LFVEHDILLGLDYGTYRGVYNNTNEVNPLAISLQFSTGLCIRRSILSGTFATQLLLWVI
jgi:hypothetical protein